MPVFKLVKDTSHPCEHPDCTEHARFQYYVDGANHAVCAEHLPKQFAELPTQEDLEQ